MKPICQGANRRRFCPAADRRRRWKSAFRRDVTCPQCRQIIVLHARRKERRSNFHALRAPFAPALRTRGQPRRFAAPEAGQSRGAPSSLVDGAAAARYTWLDEICAACARSARISRDMVTLRQSELPCQPARQICCKNIQAPRNARRRPHNILTATAVGCLYEGVAAALRRLKTQ